MHNCLKLKGHRVLNQSIASPLRRLSNEKLLDHFDFAPAHGEYMRRRNLEKRRAAK